MATYEELVTYFAAIPVERSQRYFFPQQTLRMGVLYEKAWLQWCSDVLADIAKRPV